MNIVKSTRLAALALLALAGLVACGGSSSIPTGNDPESVARQFWQHLLSDTPSNARSLAADGLAADVRMIGSHENDRLIVKDGPFRERGFQYFDTEVVLYRDQVYRIPFKTIIVDVNGDYKVDWFNTRHTFNDALEMEITNYIENAYLGAARFFGDSVFGDTPAEDLPEETEFRMLQLAEQVRESLEDYRERLMQAQ